MRIQPSLVRESGNQPGPQSRMALSGRTFGLLCQETAPAYLPVGFQDGYGWLTCWFAGSGPIPPGAVMRSAAGTRRDRRRSGEPAGAGGDHVPAASSLCSRRSCRGAGRSSLHGGTEPDLLDEVAWWQTDDFWQYALFAVVACIRAAASRTGVSVRQACQDLAQGRGRPGTMVREAGFDRPPARLPSRTTTTTTTAGGCSVRQPGEATNCGPGYVLIGAVSASSSP